MPTVPLFLCSSVPLCLLFLCSSVPTVPLFLCAYCSSVPLFLCAYCSSVPLCLVFLCSSVPLCLLFLCSSVPLCLLFLSSSVPTILAVPVFLCIIIICILMTSVRSLYTSRANLVPRDFSLAWGRGGKSLGTRLQPCLLFLCVYCSSVPLCLLFLSVPLCLPFLGVCVPLYHSYLHYDDVSQVVVHQPWAHFSLRQVKLCIGHRKYKQKIDRPTHRPTKRVNLRSLTKLLFRILQNSRKNGIILSCSN